MTEENIRGGIRSKPDPIAIATRGLKTTYEAQTIAGVATKVRVRSGKTICRRK
jgi:hypothetical protein